jgi:FtsP/CotA-like multicopper oxidase with cupredoxin domain
MTKYQFLRLTRRELLRLGGSALVLSSAAFHAKPAAAQQMMIGDTGCGVGGEAIPLSPLILDAFTEDLPIPQALAPLPYIYNGWEDIAPGKGQQNCDGDTHQLWAGEPGAAGTSPNPNLYRIGLQVGQHRITNGRVQALQFGDGLGAGTIGDVIDVDRTGIGRSVQRIGSPLNLPFSTITGFSGTPDIPHSATFPGPMINSEYWKPNLMRFVNQLGDDGGLDMGDFGDPERGFLTHLHNAHTACESDGNPNDTHHQYLPGGWVDNLYLNYPAGGDSREMQSTLWFHDHTHNHTGANVYKGMVGLYPIYDPLKDNGNEKKTNGYRLPGVRTNRPDGAFDVKYDIPLALYDCLLDDGVTPHQDWHNGCGETHPEWWGTSFFRHYPNHGFVGDVFTVNGKAYPLLKAKRRKYRLRFLNASVARCYELMFMRKRPGQTIQAVPGLQGQYSFGSLNGQGQFERDLGEQCLRPRQIASEGGLLPLPVDRDMFQVWPANRKELIVDFTKFMDGSDTKDGDEFYLVNILKMKNGRKPNSEPMHREYFADGTVGPFVPDPDFDPRYCVPLMKIVIDGGGLVLDNSRMPDLLGLDGGLRKLPPLPASFSGVPIRTFELARSGGAGGENEWIINGMPFDPLVNLARPKKGSGEIWVLKNGSGGWVHPMHLHMEEHRTIAIKRAGSGQALPLHADQPSKEDVANLGPNEEHWIYRKFRSFEGKYVAHCHNLAHEDHSMMFGWEIVP